MTREDGIVALHGKGYSLEESAKEVDTFLSASDIILLDSFVSMVSPKSVDFRPDREYRLNEEGHLVDD